MPELTREAMKPLLELQRIDSATDRLRIRLSDLPEQRELDELDAQRAEVSGTYVERNAEFDEATRRQSKLENDIEMITAKMKHEDERRSSGAVSSPRELVNIQAELDALGRRTTHLEDEQLEVMEAREVLEKDVTGLRASLDAMDAKIADATERRDAATSDIQRELGELAQQRAALVPAIHPEAIELYEELRTRKDGVAVAPLEKGTCRGCALPLSPVAMDEIKHSEEPFIRCENCRRLLVIP